MDIPERDWKLLRQLHDVALQRFCQRVLHEYRNILAEESDSPHARFLNMVELTRSRQEDIAGAFDDMRRSRALQRLIAMRRLGVVTDEDLASFSQETQEVIRRSEIPPHQW